MKIKISQSCLTILLAAALGCTGCLKEEITVAARPTFYTTDLKTVAIVPFDRGVKDPRAAKMLTKATIDAFTQNGTYRILAGPALEQTLKAAGVALKHQRGE